MIGETQTFWKGRREITQRYNTLDERIITTMEAVVELPLWLTRLPNDKLGVEVKELVSRGIKDLVNQKTKSTQNWNCVVHTTMSEDLVDANGKKVKTKHGKYRISVEYIGFYQESIHRDMNALIKSCRKRIADVKSVKNIISPRRKKSA